MNQLKIGTFIADCRKDNNLTQVQLAEKLGITDKAISKWERGMAMPDSSIMLRLCDILGISVNELLSGERIVTENINQKNDRLLLDMAEEITRKNKTIWHAMWMIMITSLLVMFGGVFLSIIFIPEGPWLLVAVIGITVLFLIPCLYALKLEVSVGAYKCKKCGQEIVPTYREALMAMHRSTTRRLKCPNCKKRTWCKKIIKK